MGANGPAVDSAAGPAACLRGSPRSKLSGPRRRPSCGGGFGSIESADLTVRRAATTRKWEPMASDKRVAVTLECTECKRRNYITNKSKVNDRERIELKKYCRWDRTHTLHKETR